MEIGSFICLDLKNSGEYYYHPLTIARLNSARAGIYHACKVYGCKSIQLPYYLCPTVKKFLSNHGIDVIPYFINAKFEPEGLEQIEGNAILLVNYFGIFSSARMGELAMKFQNVIIDNSAAFFCDPIEDCLSVYSPRKFFGVPDGCYVIGKNAQEFINDYENDYSSNTSCFLLKRVEYDLKQTYEERMKNEERIDTSDILQMSSLTRMFLSCIDYQKVIKIRRENFHYANVLYKDLNLIDPTFNLDSECVPMAYPLVIDSPDLASDLKGKQIYTGRLWSHILRELDGKHIETWLSSYMIPVPIDQRYTREDIKYVYEIITSLLKR